MPAVHLVNLNQKAVLWEKAGLDSHGRITVSAPREVRCRWTEGDNQVTDMNGQPVTINGQLRCDEDIPLGSILHIGSLDSWEEDRDNDVAGDYLEVQTRTVTPDIKGRATAHTYGATFYRDTLPTVV